MTEHGYELDQGQNLPCSNSQSTYYKIKTG